MALRLYTCSPMPIVVSVKFFIEAIDCDRSIKKIGMEAVPVDNGAGCPVPPAKKSEYTHAH